MTCLRASAACGGPAVGPHCSFHDEMAFAERMWVEEKSQTAAALLEALVQTEQLRVRAEARADGEKWALEGEFTTKWS